VTGAEMRAAGDAWVQQQMDKAAAKHGDAWPDLRDWVESYLREEVRQRLAANGVEANP
jgi:hypothetical protein